MNTWTTKLMLLVAVPAALLVAGCQSDIPKADMDAIGAWSIAMCACAEKSGAEAKQCASALKQPSLEQMSNGRPKFKLDSVHAYSAIESTGFECERKIPK